MIYCAPFVVSQESNMGKRGNDRERSRRQAIMRERRGERAFLFDKDLSRCLAEFEREAWEFAIRKHQGDVTRAAEHCGITQVPGEAKVLWGVSAPSALETYKRWQKKRR